MNNVFARALAAIFLLWSCAFCMAQNATPPAAQASPGKPGIVVLATGGTIADPAGSATLYTAQQLVDAIPQLKQIANVTAEDFAAIDSENMTNEIWLRLAKRVNEILAQPDVTGVVITHGTDTLEETAYFLHLVIKSDKPVVMTGAMRKPGILSADGPANLFEAVEVAAAPQAAGRGVFVVMNDQIFCAREVTKMNDMRLDAFQAPNRGPSGFVVAGFVALYAKPTQRYGSQSELSVQNVTDLPAVEIVYGYTNMGRELIDDAVQRKVKGIVIAAVGAGSLSHTASEALTDAAKHGIAVVRTSRVPSGVVGPNIGVDDSGRGFVAGLDLSPQKARILLMLGLLKTSNPAELQKLFFQY